MCLNGENNSDRPHRIVEIDIFDILSRQRHRDFTSHREAEVELYIESGTPGFSPPKRKVPTGGE